MNLAQITELNEAGAIEYLESIRWPDGPICPHCGAMGNIVRINGKSARPGLLRCRDCRGQFTVKVGTIFASSHIPLRKWLMAFSIMCASKKGVSALQLQRQLGLGSYQTAWHLAHRVRHAMKTEPLASMLKGTVEVDETYVGGKPRKGTGEKSKRGRGTKKTPVIALVERNGRVRSYRIGSVSGKTLKGAIRENVDRSATIMTDDLKSYGGIGKEFQGGHYVIRHSSGEYSRNGINTNTAESYFALLKRGMMGAFHHVSKKHLDRYCDEFAFRWNHRHVTDGERTVTALKMVEGKRLMYRQPIGRMDGASG